MFLEKRNVSFTLGTHRKIDGQTKNSKQVSFSFHFSGKYISSTVYHNVIHLFFFYICNMLEASLLIHSKGINK